MADYIPHLAIEPKRGILHTLTRTEIDSLREAGENGVHELLRRCAIAVLNTGNPIDDAAQVLELYRDFDMRIEPTPSGIRLDLINVPINEHVFVDGEVNAGTQEHLFSVVRDIVFFRAELERTAAFDLDTPQGITDAVFAVFRNAGLIDLERDPALVVCWGGHSITRREYDYSKMVGYHLGLRRLDVGTGCGPGAMKGPMKGAALGHLKQRVSDPIYLGITEPGIIAAESPNPVVNHLVIFPDIEKRLEAFVRRAHGIVVFPGGVGTAEELLYLLGLLMHPANAGLPFPVVLTADEKSAGYFTMLDAFIDRLLGPKARSFYSVVVNDPAQVARRMLTGIADVTAWRRDSSVHPHFNGVLHIPHEFQQPFVPTHEAVRALNLDPAQPLHLFAANLRRMFSAIVAGNVKADGIRRIAEHGPYEIHAPRSVMKEIDALLATFVAQGRMKINGRNYRPCYVLKAE